MSTPCVLVVADPERIAELVAALSEPLTQGLADLLVSSGGDDTIDLFQARRPDAIVVTATLEAGDCQVADRGAARLGAARRCRDRRRRRRRRPDPHRARRDGSGARPVRRAPAVGEGAAVRGVDRRRGRAARAQRRAGHAVRAASSRRRLRASAIAADRGRPRSADRAQRDRGAVAAAGDAHPRSPIPSHPAPSSKVEPPRRASGCRRRRAA